MELSGIISITGMPGLYKVVAQSTNGIIVESLVDKKRLPAYSSYKISALEDISIFSENDDVPLSTVLQKIYDKEKGGPIADMKGNDAALKEYFGKVMPDYDKNRVYTSDIKKVLNWYNLLQKNDLLKTVEKEKDSKPESKEDAAKALKAKEKTAVPKVKPKDPGVSAKGATGGSKARKTNTIRKTGA
jgi:hypothetical protein